jgi:DNA-binding response OmpR family regulator
VTRVLVVDDEEAIRDAVAYILRADGNEVDVAANGTDAIDAAVSRPYDLLVLDVLLPDISGVEVTRRVRAEKDVPIIMLTARSSEADLVVGFEAGADDYVRKPFSVHELLSRAHAVLRRGRLGGASDVQQRAGDVELDLIRHEARVAGSPVQLTPTEFRLLRKLAEEDRPYSRRELLEAAWETVFVPDERSCDVHVANIRRKVEDDASNPRRIVTVRGVGYRLTR